MSYKTTDALQKRGLQFSQFALLSVSEQEEVLLDALQTELGLGVDFVAKAADRFDQGERDSGCSSRLLVTVPADPSLKKQVIRLMFDMPKKTLESHHGLRFGFYDPGVLVVASSQEDLQMTHAEQFELRFSDLPEVQGPTAETDQSLDPAERSSKTLDALRSEYSLGMDFVEETIESFKDGKTTEDAQHLMVSKDPLSETGQQAIALLTSDIYRATLSEYYGLALGAYNCCGFVVANNVDELGMSVAKQVKLQTTPDC